MKLEYGKQYVTRNGLVTGPLEKANNGTCYAFGAWVQEPYCSDLSRCCWLDTGEFLGRRKTHRLDLVEVYEPEAEHPECCGEPMTIDGRVVRCEVCQHQQEIHHNHENQRILHHVT